MDEKTLIDSLKTKSGASDTTISLGRGEVLMMVELLEKKSKRIEELEKKTEVLATHVMELTQEMENIKMDFGNNR
jgi:hypothetical protein